LEKAGSERKWGKKKGALYNKEDGDREDVTADPSGPRESKSGGLQHGKLRIKGKSKPKWPRS